MTMYTEYSWMPAAKSYSYICNSTSVERCSFICKTTGRIIDSVIKTEDMIGFLLANLIFCEINRRFYGILILGWTYIDTQGWGGGKVKSNLYIAGRPGVGGMGGGGVLHGKQKQLSEPPSPTSINMFRSCLQINLQPSTSTLISLTICLPICFHLTCTCVIAVHVYSFSWIVITSLSWWMC